MIEFLVKDMAGAACASTIVRVVRETVPAASVEVDLSGRMIRIRGASDPEELERAIREVGYTPARRQ